MATSMTFDEAKQYAQALAKRDLAGLYECNPAEMLESRVPETEHCWMFFRNRAIEIPPERALSAFAYAINKRTGKARSVADFWDDEARLQAYLKIMSDHFATRDE